MSLDFQLAWPCPHLTVEEVVSLGDDRRSLRMRQPIASAGSILVVVNDDSNLFIPQGGLYSAAALSSSVSGPYDIRKGADTLTVETSGGSSTLSFGAKALTRKTTDQVIQAIQRAGWSTVTVVNDGGYLAFIDHNAVGPSAFVRVKGTAAAALGFGLAGVSGRQWAVTGREVYPGWDLYLRPDEITNRYIRFRKPLKNNPMIKVTYTVPRQRCLRCQATGVENDFRFDASGSSILIANENLLYQAALKILLTDRGSNPFHPWYGTSIRERIGTKALAGVSSVLSEDVRQALSRMQSLQAEQAKYQQVTFKERLYSILGVSVKRHQQDPTTYLIEVTVQNASSEPISLDIVYTAPEVVALMGTNGLMLGTEAVGLGADRVMFRNDRNTLTGGQ